MADEVEEAFPGLVVEGVERDDDEVSLEVSLPGTSLEWKKKVAVAGGITDDDVARIVDAIRKHVVG